MSKQPVAIMLDVFDFIEGKRRYITFSDGSVVRSRKLKPLLHNGKKPRW